MWGRGEEQMTKMIHWLEIVKCDMTNKARLSQHKYLHLHIQILLNWKMVSVIMFLWAIFIFFQYNLNLFVEPHRNLLEIKTLSMSSSPPPPGSSSTDNTSWCPLFRPAPSQQLRGRQVNLQKISCCWPNKSWPHIICSYLLSSNLSICYSEIGFLIHISQCFLFNFLMTDIASGAVYRLWW